MSEVEKEIMQSLLVEKENLKKQIQEKEAEALELSKKHLNLQWNIKKSDFIAFYEEKERELDREVIKELSNLVKNAEEKWSGLDKRLEESKNLLNKLSKEKEENNLELQHLREINAKNEGKHFELKRTVVMLKNRNAAMKLKLTKQAQEFEEKIQKLSSQF